MVKKALATFIASMIFVIAVTYPASATALKVELTKYGKCRVTAYCGKEGGTKGASGNELIANVSCAASRNIPLGTELYIDGLGFVTVEDRMAKWYDNKYDGMVVDIYLSDMSAVREWGMHKLDVYIVNDKELTDEEE